MLLFLTILCCTTLGFAGTPTAITVAGTAIILTILTIGQDRAIAVQFSSLSASRVLSLAIVQSYLSNLVFAVFSFAFGRAVAWALGGFL